MSFRNREIELKLVVIGKSLSEVNEIIHSLVGSSVNKVVTGESNDWYWALPDPATKADFIRLRDLDSSHCQITVKSKDKSDLIDRLEIDVDCTTYTSKVLKLLTVALGPPSGEINKEYRVFWPSSDANTNISCYKVHGEPGIFVEIESTSRAKVLDWEQKVTRRFEELGINICRASGSLFEMFILRRA